MNKVIIKIYEKKHQSQILIIYSLGNKSLFLIENYSRVEFGINLLVSIQIIIMFEERIMNKIKCGEEENEFRARLNDVKQLEQRKQYYQMLLPKSSLQLKLTQKLLKSKKNPTLEKQFEELSRIHSHTIHQLAEKQGQINFLKEKNIFLKSQNDSFIGLLKIIQNSFEKILSLSFAKEENSFRDYSLDTSNYFFKQYEEFITDNIRKFEKKIISSKEAGKNSQPANFLELQKDLKKIMKENESLKETFERQRKEHEEKQKGLSSEIQACKEKLKQFQKEEEECENLTKGLDLKLKNRTEVILILKGMIKKYQRLEKFCKVEKKLCPEDFEEIVNGRDKIYLKKKQSSATVFLNQ